MPGEEHFPVKLFFNGYITLCSGGQLARKPGVHPAGGGEPHAIPPGRRHGLRPPLARQSQQVPGLLGSARAFFLVRIGYFFSYFNYF